jgi:hypothetical protein
MGTRPKRLRPDRSLPGTVFGHAEGVYQVQTEEQAEEQAVILPRDDNPGFQL